MKSPVSGAEWSRLESWFQTTSEYPGKLLNLSALSVLVCRMGRLIIVPASLDCDEDRMSFSQIKTYNTSTMLVSTAARDKNEPEVKSNYVSLEHRLLQKQTYLARRRLCTAHRTYSSPQS